MKAEIKTKWVTALRSGEYKQNRNNLRTDDKFCCLGVLCDIFIKENKIPEDEGWKIVANGKYDIYHQTSGEVLPSYVYIWAHLDSPNPSIHGRTLAQYNDTHYSFSEIADLIEKHL